MSPQRFQLLRIIIIDSFWKGKINEIRFDGHTQLEGTNGAGKTSLMRLLPLFYGMRPGEIVSKVDQAKNFVDYYLPRESSLLVYEYQRVNAYGSQVCCMVASSNGRSIQYKLIDAGYEQAHFISADHKTHKMADIERHYGRNVFHSVYLNVNEYRQVIQCLREGRTSSKVRDLQGRFAFGQGAIPHVDKVVNGTIEKNLDFGAVKKMLVAISADFLARDHGQQREPMQLNRDEIGGWLSDIQASRAVSGAQDKIARWQTEFNELSHHLHQLRHLLAQLLQATAQVSTEQADSDNALKVLNQAIKEAEKAHEQHLEQQKEQLYQNQDRLLQCSMECERLDKQKQAYDDDDAAAYQIKADEKQRFSRELHEIESLIFSLEGDLRQVQEKYRELLSQGELTISRSETNIQKQMAAIEQQTQLQLRTVDEQFAQQRRELEKQLAQAELALEKQQFELTHQQQQNAAARITPQVEPQWAQAVQQSQQQLTAVQQQRHELSASLADITQHLNRCEREREQQLHQLTQEQRRLQELQQDAAALTLQLHPAKHSLHQFLVEQEACADWKQTIGALLSPQLLARTDLSPQWQGEGVTTLYGVQLDLAALQENNPLSRNEAQLTQQLAEKSAQISQQEQLLLELQQWLVQNEELIRADKQKVQLSQQNERQLSGQIGQLQQQLERQQQQLDEQLHQRLQQLDAEALALQKVGQQLAQQLKLQQQQAEEHEGQLRLRYQEQRMELETECNSQVETLKNQFDEQLLQHQTQQEQYRQQQKQALTGLDPDGEIDRLNEQRKQLAAKLQRCAEFEQKAREYQAFIDSQFCHRNALGNELLSLQQQVEQGSQQVAQQEHQHQQQKNKQKQQRTALREQLERAETLLVQLQGAQTHCARLELTARLDPDSATYQAAMLPAFIQQNLEAFTSLEKTLAKEVNHFANALRVEHGKSSLFDSWLKSVAEHDHFVGCESILKYQVPTQALLESATQLKRSTSLLIQTNANMINEFYQHLVQFDRRIKSVGRQLSERVTELAKFEAFAGINVGTVTKLDQLEYWRPLASFADRYDQAKDQLQDGQTEIPEELIAAMRDLARVLPSEGVQLQHDELFDLEFVITEKGQVKRARTAAALKKVSSTGLSYLAMLSLFAGLLAMLRGKSHSPSSIILPVDEMGELAAENIKLLLEMFDHNAIQILSASPATDRQVLALYQNSYKLKDSKIYKAHIPQSKFEQLLAARAAKSTTTVHAATMGADMATDNATTAETLDV